MMPSFLDVIVFLSLVIGLLTVICTALVILYGVAMALRYIFEQHIKNSWENSWWGRNFDFPALFCISIPALTLFFVTLPSYISIYYIIEKHTLLIGALLGFPILIRRVSETRLQSRSIQYNAANELLWSERLDSRMAGIEALWRVAQTYPKEEYGNVMNVFSQFVKHPASYEWKEGTKKEDKKAGKRKDISAILEHMGEERMAGAELYEIDLRGTHLERADLGGVHLEGADLVGAHLDEADLGGAHLEGAHLEGAYLKGAHLEIAYLAGVHLEWAHLEGAYLEEAHLEGAYLEGARLERADLGGAHLKIAYLGGAHLEAANLEWAHLEGVNLGRAHLKGANLSDVHLEGANLHGAHLTLAIINGADFAGTKSLSQEQINGCVFITNHPLQEQQPTLPDGIEHKYQKMSIKEWEAKSGRKFGDFNSW